MSVRSIARLIVPALAVCVLLVAVVQDAWAAPVTQPGATSDACYDTCIKGSGGGKTKTADQQYCKTKCFVTGVASAQTAPPVAAATQASNACDALFAKLRAAPSVSVWWTTNYFANGYRFMGVTALELRAREGDLVGQGQRHRVAPGADGLIERRLLGAGAVSGPEIVTLRIRTDGQIMLNDRYGPYAPVCWSERFAGFHSGDSVETFNFQLP